MRIAIIEDNQTLANAIAYRLRDKGHATDLLHNGAEANRFLATEGADLVVLDINLPGMTGLEVLRALRARNDGTPVILLTARNELSDKVIGLDAGADDYLVKPFDMEELEARIRVHSRHKNIVYGEIEKIGKIEYDRTNRQIFLSGQQLDIPRREIAVFECLIERQGRLVPKPVLTDHVYGVGAAVSDTAIEPHISRLRKRLHGGNVEIKSARGLGYMLAESN